MEIAVAAPRPIIRSPKNVSDACTEALNVPIESHDPGIDHDVSAACKQGPKSMWKDESIPVSPT